MSTWVIVQRPMSGLFAGHVEEARRALAAQGVTDVSDERIARGLWCARALPVALDVLSDTRAQVETGRLSIGGVRVLRCPDGGALVEGQLVAVAIHEAGSAALQVRFVPPALAAEADATTQLSAAVVEVSIVPLAVDDDTTEHDVVLSRFTHGGRPGDDGVKP
jgi:hypothetical protein